jgi:hypothetical protein
MIGLLNHSMQGDADSISSATGKTNSDTPAWMMNKSFY